MRDSRSRQGRIRAAAAMMVLTVLLLVPGVAAAASPPKLDARAWTLVDPTDDAVLAAKAPNKRLPIASATKLMTAYLALHELRPNQVVTAPGYRPSNPAEVTLGLHAGERIRVRDLLYALLLPSAGDAAETLAVAVSGSLPAFVADMNRTARRLGLRDTSYANPIGLDDPDNYSSAHDLAALASILLRNRLFARIVNTPSETLRSGDQPRTVTNRNTLLGRAPWVDGVKTGHTLDAGYVLVGSGMRGSTRLISVVLGTPSEYVRDQSSLELLDYGFSLYHPVAEVRAGEEVASPKLDYRDDHLPLIARRPLTVTVREGDRVATRLSAPDEVSGAVRQGQVLGRVTVTVDGRQVAVSPLVAAHAVGAATTLDKALSTAQNPILLIVLAGIVILLGLVLIMRGRGAREDDPPPRAPQERQRSPRQRTPEERRQMHEERMRRRRRRVEREGGPG